MKVGSNFTCQKENQRAFFGKQKKGEGIEKIRNEQSTRQVILTAFWDCCNQVYAEFGPDVYKEKRKVT